MSLLDELNARVAAVERRLLEGKIPPPAIATDNPDAPIEDLFYDYVTHTDAVREAYRRGKANW